MTTATAQAKLLRSLHVPGTPLIVTNVWDAITAKIVASAPGVKALATASHAVSFAQGVEDGEGLTVEQALAGAELIVSSVEIPVSIDFEKGYAQDAAGVQRNVERLISVGAAGDTTKVERALAEIDGTVSVISTPTELSARGEYPGELGFRYEKAPLISTIVLIWGSWPRIRAEMGSISTIVLFNGVGRASASVFV